MQALEKLAGGSLMDAVIHDGAPNIGGAWASESASQTALALQALRLATFFMAPKATFVSKVFRSAFDLHSCCITHTHTHTEDNCIIYPRTPCKTTAHVFIKTAMAILLAIGLVHGH